MAHGISIKDAKEREAQTDKLTNYLLAGITVLQLKKHPNYEDKIPLDNETKVQFTLRMIAHLISPPMEESETNEIECIDISCAVLAMNDEIEKIWEEHEAKFKK